MGRILERSRGKCCSPFVWWVRETEAKQKIRELNHRIKTLEAIIRSARTEFFKEAIDGKTCVRMLDVLASADDQDHPPEWG